VSPFETEQQTALYEALCDLPSKYLTVVQLFYFEDLSIARIAETLQVEQGTVKTRLSRARAQLRARLK
jgi:RNA polymerase sigma-70 factor (ECF subfamily)